MIFAGTIGQTVVEILTATSGTSMAAMRAALLSQAQLPQSGPLPLRPVWLCDAVVEFAEAAPRHAARAGASPLPRVQLSGLEQASTQGAYSVQARGPGIPLRSV